jgi:hypothetical protein
LILQFAGFVVGNVFLGAGMLGVPIY